MKHLLLLPFALSFVAAAQTMVGLPANGVNLTGNQATPILTNVSSKAIFAVVVRSESDQPVAVKVETVWFDYSPIPPAGQRVVSLTGSHGSSPPSSGAVISRVSLDGLVFEDGSFVGPDKSGIYHVLVKQIDAFVATGLSLSTASDKAAAWKSVSAQATDRSIDASITDAKEAHGQAFARQSAARSILNARFRVGDNPAAGYSLAAKYMALGALHPAN
jgi:hypothetical protein